ncbi:amino acid adenylation domain-containing protein [Hymenobacter sp. HSC-4F20]|uniref:non-ribosomal peptide synthetase n=1 Tax=Hymenobacter sp. HSC-4F20 TaxID=2864135 RepID=UPI001C72A5C8|nr:non-ribosomal peptide synthetase [Hymenobacter sp. HSC-4F20]MBX0293013.1 amino acid adenylation domain-containing protein [Hymenobacter sp. HSC-4F20]
MNTTLSLSYHQERLWFIDTFEKGKLYEASPVYHNLPLLLQIDGPLDPECLRAAVAYLVGRHEVLRCQLQEGEFPALTVAATLPVPLEQRPLPEVGPAGVAAALRPHVQEPFDLQSGVLHRTTLFTNGQQQHYLLWVFHHFIVDRFSVQVLFEELTTVYQQLAQGAAPELAPLELQYVDYALWQKEFPEETVESLLFYWKHELKGNVQALEIATDAPRDHIHLYDGQTYNFRVPAPLAQQLQALGAAHGHSGKEVLLTAFLVLLHHYSGLEEVVVGTFGDNHRQHLGPAAGPADNLLVIRSFLDRQQHFPELLGQVAGKLEQALAYQELPFEQLCTLLNPAKDMSRTAFFDVLFHYEAATPARAAAGATWTYQETNSGLGKYDLNLLFKEDAAGELGGYLTFNQRYFDPTTVAAFCENLLYWLSQLSASPEQLLARLPYLAPAQEAALAAALDFTAVAFPTEENLVSLFACQAQAVPDNTAVVFYEEQLSYAALHEYSTQFAAYLQEHHQVHNEDFVSVCLPRSGHLIGVMLGILKAGGCYIPVDPGYPRERIDYIVADSRSKVLVDQAVLDEFLSRRAELPTQVSPVAIAPEQLAYVIYTSGTTGRPKGVKVSHRNVVRLLFNEQNLFDFHDQDVWTMFHSYCFDFSVWEMYGALLYGGKLVVVPEIVAKDTELFWQLLVEQRVTVLNQTPSAFYRLIHTDATQQGATLPALRYVIFGGEALAPLQLKDWAVKYPRTQLINMYGITETTVHVTYKQINQPEIESGISNIGQPIPTLGCYILSQDQQPVPRGVVGELYVAGEGVAHGYLNQEQLTAQRFVELPVAPGRCLYRSGDLARITLSGDLEYLGRIDNQVKIRGHRIELGEIENNLLKHEQVETAVVVALKDEDGDNFLVAYYTGEDTLSAKELRLYVQLHVPPYMVPAYFVRVPTIPLTFNGKVDRSKLPNPKAYVEDETTLYVAPRTGVEQEMVAIWQELLGLPKVSVKDNFFDLGGHSLKATQLISRISERLGATLRLSEIFAHPVLEELTQMLELQTAAPTSWVILPRAGEQPSYPLSAAQKRLWVLQQMQPESTAYNMSSAYLLPAPLDPALLQDALGQLLERHEILRTVFRKDEYEQVAQWVLPALAAGEVFTYYPEALPLEEVAARFRTEALRPFDLATAPLLKIALYKTEEAQYALGYVMHHIISDGWSMNVFFTELLALYHGLLRQQAVPLPALPFQYKDYAAWQQQQLAQGLLAQQGAYWQEQFRGGWPRLDLIGQKPRPAVKTSAGALAEFTVAAPQLQALEQLCHSLGGSLFMGLFTLVNALVARHTALTDVVLGVPTAGREFVSIEKQIGCYINTLALRTRFSPDDTLAQLFENVKQTVLAGFEHQSYPFDKLVDDLRLKRDVSRSPLFDMMVVLQNTQDVNVAAGSGLETGPELAARPLTYTGENSKFDLTWFFVETEKKELLLRLEYNTDLYEAATMEQLAGHFTTLLHLFLEHAGQPLRALELDPATEWAGLAARPAAALEHAGLFATPEPQPERREAAVGPKEARLLAVWQDVLGLETISRTDDFFALGGDSIKAIQLVAKLKKHQLHLSVAEVMQHATLQEMAAVLRADQMEIEEETVRGVVPLSPIQQYFFSAMTTAPAHYNQSVVLHSATPLDLNRLTAVLHTLTERHDMLRAVYHQENGTWVQQVRPHQDSALEVHHFRDVTLAENLATVEALSDKAQASFDLTTGPLFKCVLYQHQDQDTVLLCAHHLLVDGVSWRILLEDFEALYTQSEQAAPALPKTHSYRKWVQHLQALADSALLQDAGARWQAVEQQLTVLPKDAPQAPNQEQDAVQVHLQLSAHQTQVLSQAAHRVLKADVQDLLVAALGQSLQACFGVAQPGLMLENHGRSSVMSLDLSRTVGWFTALFPVVLPPSQPDKLRYLMEVKEALREYGGVSSHYGIWRYLGGGQSAAAPSADICFNYLGQFQASATTDRETTFTLSTEGKGTERAAQQSRLFALEATAAIAGQELQLSLRYGARQYQPATMQRLLAQWHEQLLQLAAACEAAETQFLTASDVTAQDVDMTALLQLQQQCAVEDAYPLSPMQQGFYYYHARYPGSTAYFEQTRYRLQGPLQPALVAEALQQLARRHAVMRTIFRDNLGAEVLQVVLADRLPEGGFLDLLEEEAPEPILDHYAEQDRARGFDLQRELPIRWHLFRLQPEVFELVLSYHHIIMDGWCMPLILHEFQALYQALSQQVPAALPASPPYVDYIQWLDTYPEAAGKEYWRQYLSGYVGGAGMSRAEEDTHELVRDLATVELTLAGTEFQELQQVTRETGTTLNELLQALWGVYLGSRSQRQDVVFGTVVSGRPAELPGVEAMVGLFINTLPVRVRFQREESLRQVMERVREQAIASLPYHYTPLSDMPHGRAAGGALFDHLMVFRNYPMQEPEQAPWELLHVKSYEPNNLDFSIHVLPNPGSLTIRFVYLPGKFSSAEMQQLRDTFAGLVQQFRCQPEVSVAALQQRLETQRSAQRKSSVKQRLVSLKK